MASCPHTPISTIRKMLYGGRHLGKPTGHLTSSTSNRGDGCFAWFQLFPDAHQQETGQLSMCLRTSPWMVCWAQGSGSSTAWSSSPISLGREFEDPCPNVPEVADQWDSGFLISNSLLFVFHLTVSLKEIVFSRLNTHRRTFQVTKYHGGLNRSGCLCKAVGFSVPCFLM